jgi:putative effector of murein hydrolase
MITFAVHTLSSVILTLVSYCFGLKLFLKYKKAWLNPLLTASFLLIFLLLLLHINVEVYQQGSSIFNQILEVAVVALAVPLYKQWAFLKKNYEKICLGVIGGTIIGITSVIVLAQLFELKSEIIAALIPRSITLPIAITLSTALGGIKSTTVFFVVFSGLVSLLVGPKLLKQLGIRSKVAKGLAMGTSAQMLGANRSFQWGEEEGAMGSIAMTTSALFLSFFVPILSIILKI